MSTSRHSVLPGLRLTLGFTILYLFLIVIVPLFTLPLKTSTLTWQRIWQTIGDPRVGASYKLSLWTALAAAAVNSIFGLLVAWVLARYAFPGKRVVDALIDLPFALPTAVAGITLTAIYAETGWIGQYLARYDIRVAFTPLGVLVALTFVGLPFVVRSVPPVLEDPDVELEKAARSLGATRWQTFTRVILPMVLPALMTGFALAFARA